MQIQVQKQLVNKFRRVLGLIPEENWCVDRFTDLNDNIKHCVLGHLGTSNCFVLSQESVDLIDLFHEYYYHPARVNNGRESQFQQNTPKTRILAALDYIEKQIEEKYEKCSNQQTVS